MTSQPFSVLAARLVLALGSTFVAIVLLGPFQGAEHALNLTDKQAHGLAFYIFTTVAFAAAPKVRWKELAMAALALAAASEIAQSLVGRDGSLGDVMADATGIVLATAPVAFMRIRRGARAQVQRRRRADRPMDGAALRG